MSAKVALKDPSNSPITGSFVITFIVPPSEPNPYRVPDGPRKTSTLSVS